MPIDDWSSKYNGMPMYVAPLSNGNKITFETMLDQPAESFRKVDEVQAELEFRYVTDADLKALQDVTSPLIKQLVSNWIKSLIDWWLDTFMNHLNIDGFSMTIANDDRKI